MKAGSCMGIGPLFRESDRGSFRQCNYGLGNSCEISPLASVGMPLYLADSWNSGLESAAWGVRRMSFHVAAYEAEQCLYFNLIVRNLNLDSKRFA